VPQKHGYISDYNLNKNNVQLPFIQTICHQKLFLSCTIFEIFDIKQYRDREI